MCIDTAPMRKIQVTGYIPNVLDRIRLTRPATERGVSLRELNAPVGVLHSKEKPVRIRRFAGSRKSRLPDD
jgi:hypothetical protein